MANGRRTRTTRWSAFPVPERWAFGEHQLGAGRRGGRALEGMKRVSKSRAWYWLRPFTIPHIHSVFVESTQHAQLQAWAGQVSAGQLGEAGGSRDLTSERAQNTSFGAEQLENVS